jgi:hypothetical protein
MPTASCLCGTVRLEIAEPPARVTECNCSACRRLGALWAYVHPDQVRLLAPPDATIAFVRGEGTLAFHHCRTCGCTTHWVSLDPQQTERMAINARLLPPEVLTGVPVRKFDGAVSWTYLD